MLSILCVDTGPSVLMIEAPDFISKILPLGEDIASNGLYSALPFALMAIVSPATGTIADYAISKGVISRLNSQKLFHCLQHT